MSHGSRRRFTLMGFALGAALMVAFLLEQSGAAAAGRDQPAARLLDRGRARRASEEAAGQRRIRRPASPTRSRFIGQRMRNVEEVFSALKENLDQILGNLQDGILLFTGDGRAVLVSEAARRFLRHRSGSMLGLHAREIFDRSTVLGQTLREAFEPAQPWRRRRFAPRPDGASRLRWISSTTTETRQGLGALVTLHDLESVEEIESELELSRRMAAIGRLTSGVGHEVKNPINAIVVHLELLKTKLGDASAPAVRHLEVIDAEIHRLDRVVQTLVDFSRPVELQLREQDLRPVIGDVLALAAEELSTHNVTLVSRLPSKPLMANIDADLLKQAVLNVIQNGAQAMPRGRQAGGGSRRRRERSPCCASPMRVRAFPRRFGKRSSTSISPPRAEAAASVWQ